MEAGARENVPTEPVTPSGTAGRPSDQPGTERRHHLVVWALVFLLWLLMVLAFAAQLVFRGSLDWPRAVEISLRDWFPWALLTPAVAWLAFRFPLERDKLRLSLPVHLGACIAVVALAQFLTHAPAPHRPDSSPPRGPRPPPAHAPGPQVGPQPPLPPGPPPPEMLHVIFVDLLGRRSQFNIPIYWIIVSIAHALRYYRRSQEREKRALELEGRLTQARLEALRMQLQPHFLFNTLNAISSLLHNDPRAADEMIGNLSSLLRATLDSSADQEVPLRKELELLSLYLEIQQARFGSRLALHHQIPADVLDAKVPILILQPIVENAIKHGIEANRGAGTITLDALAENDVLKLRVTDDGPGVRTDAVTNHGIGLSNTEARLRALYGRNALLTLRTGPTGGCSAELILPLQRPVVS